MANPTTNYGFVLPTATDLVTDLPADFDVALQGVDTRLKALQPGTTLGDLAYSSATANTNTRLPIGTNGQVLAVSGGVPAWTTTSDVTPLTTKGDLFTFTTVDARIGVGANGTVLTADSAEATGLKWATPSAGANWSLLNSGGTALSGVSSVTVSGISNASQVLIIHENVASGTANSIVSLRLNGDTATNYDRRVQVTIQPQTSYATGISSATAQTNDDQLFMGQQANSTGANAVINGYALISGASTSGVKPIFIVSGGANDGSAGFQATRIGTSIYDSSSAVSSVTFRTTNASNFTGGTIFVYTTA